MSRKLLIPILLCLSVATQAQVENGFDLSDALIDTARIQRGGPPRDGIPAIDRPKFVAAEAAGFLEPEDRVIGVYRDGVAKAYPIRIMNWHEIVNDEIAGQGTLVTYCPLCGTGMVFDVDDDEIASTFGVSGLLYNSDVLLYDRRTDSLWSQILGQAVTGPLKGTTLPLLPSRHTSWSEWRHAHPETLVLSTDTGFRRDYARSPYLDYERSNRLMFDVEARSRAYENKSLVLGVAIGDRYRAYPFEELEDHGGERIVDTFAGRELTVVRSPSADSAYVLDEEGRELPSVLAYWFAWYAFHPDTEVFQAGR